MLVSHTLVDVKRRITSWTLVVMTVTTAAFSATGTLASVPKRDTAIVRWNEAALIAVRETHPGPPMAARMIAITNTCMYDAWAAYSVHAVGTQLGDSLRRPPKERTLANKNEAISFAAFRALSDLFPTEVSSVFQPLMLSLGYDPANLSTDVTTPAGIGTVACGAVLAFRHNDGANQLGDLHPGAYSDYTGYLPINPPSTLPVSAAGVLYPDHWQPLIYDDGATAPLPHIITQSFVGAQWFKVIPFALTSANQFETLEVQMGPALFGSAAYRKQADDLIQISANLTDKQKMIAEYWANGPRSELPPGHWCLFAEYVSRRDHHSVNQDAKMFFAVTNAILDASIASWTPKRTFDSVRPVTAIPYLYSGQQIKAWVPFHGTQPIDGSDWRPYQKTTFPTPPFPEFISGHSTFSAAAAEVLRLYTGSTSFGDSVTFPAGSSVTEPGLVPATAVTLTWDTFLDAANEAGISRRYGGIHFEAGDLAGREVGRLVGAQAWQKAVVYFNPYSDDLTDSEDEDSE